MTIFVIDDHPLMRDAIATVLRRLRPDLGTVELACLADLERKTINEADACAIFLDLNLPDAPGASGVRKVRLRFPGVPVAVYSASPAADVEAECISAGADLYLEKTTDSQGLAMALRRLMASSSAP